jgi:hypothetical protein
VNDSVDDSELYVIANREVDTNTQDDILWRKAMALNAGNREKAKYKYFKLRVQQLKKTGVPKSKVNLEPKAKPTKEEKKVDTDNSYEEERIAEIDEALNKNNKQVKDKSDDKNMLKGISLMLFIIAVVIWGININKSSKSTKTTYIEKPAKIDSAKQNEYNYKNSSYDNKYSLQIDTYPSNATVKIMNIGSKYSYGMYLIKGNYRIQVSSYGYKTKTEWINLVEDTNKYIDLSSDEPVIKKKKAVEMYPLTINTIPSDAKVQIMNINPKYYDGIMLKKGIYNIRVSKYGYETQEGTANPFEYATYNVTLDKNKKTSSYSKPKNNNYSNNNGLPAHAKIDIYGTGWDCQRGYFKSGNQCIKVNIPTNGKVDIYGTGWDCQRGYFKSGNQCVKVNIPTNGKVDIYGTGWDCQRGYFKSGNQCIKVGQ